MFWTKPSAERREKSLALDSYISCAMWWITIGCLYFFVMLLKSQVETSAMVGAAAWLFFCLFGCMRALSLRLYDFPEECCVFVQLPQLVFWLCGLLFYIGPAFALVSWLAFIIGFLLLGLPARIVGSCDSIKASIKVAWIFSYVISGMVTCVFFVLFPLFVGTIYLLTNHYTTNGLVLVFVFLPPVVWPVSYIFLVRSTILIFLLVFIATDDTINY